MKVEEGGFGKGSVGRWDRGLLSQDQAVYIAEVFPHVTLREDLSWGLTDTRVLHAESGGRGIVIKAAGAANRHIRREITGRQRAPHALVDHGVIGSMLAARRDLNVVAVEHVGRGAR